ncbi:phage tail tape measure protein [Pseudomonas sp. C2B4]|uniref:phage tail tape measure protein n=1 Tax=Pseudomonas sp. C2B4 TaxID=2735270 RepID=UPI001585D980|nr:phage tail tape measure protein [Pseudomonas sp. C2B4]NUU35634.1 phage tail tape measure protein [Pseudomonas sp. C2B4]
MADTKYSLRNAGFNTGDISFGEVGQGVTVMNSAPLEGLSQALVTISLKVGLLTAAIDSLNLRLSLPRPLSQPLDADVKGITVSGQKSTDKTSGGFEPPDLLKSAIAMDSAMADLRAVAQLTQRQSDDMAQSTQQMAIAPLVAAGGTTAVDLTRVEALAASAGIGNDLPNASDRQFELMHFASDAAVTASAFKVPAMEVGEMMAGWRTSMKLSGVQAFDLADATNHLGKIPGGAQAADVGAILQHHGRAATATGLIPEQAAALSAALLNTGTQKADAGSAFKNIVTALGKGDQVSSTERNAWSQLGIDPREVAGLLRDKDQAPGAVMSVLAALNAQPAENRSTLATTLFANGDEAAMRLSQNLADLNEAFWQVKDKRQYATSERGDQGSIRQSALTQSNTRQGQWNIFNARSDRLSTATGDALAPATDITLSSLGALVDALSELAETFPRTTAVIVVAAAAIKPLVGGLFKAVVDEMTNQVAKKVLGGAAARLPGRFGEVFSEDFRAGSRGDKTGMSTKPGTGSPVGLTKSAGPREVRASTARYALGPVAALRPLVRRAPGPLKIIGAVADVAEGAMAGDKRMIGAGLGAAGGGWAGATAGSVAGAALGSVVPVIGTAIGGLLGGLIGGWLGSESGASLGEKLAAPAADRLGSPAQVSNDLISTRMDNQPITFNSTIQINGQDQASARELANLVVQTTLGQLGQFMPTNALATRRDTALTDGAA